MRYKPIHAWSWKKTHASVFFHSFLWCVLWLNDKAKVSERANRNMPAKNMLVQLWALTPTLTMHRRQTEWETDWGRTDRWQDCANSRSYCNCVVVQSAEWQCNKQKQSENRYIANCACAVQTANKQTIINHGPEERAQDKFADFVKMTSNPSTLVSQLLFQISKYCVCRTID